MDDSTVDLLLDNTDEARMMARRVGAFYDELRSRMPVSAAVHLSERWMTNAMAAAYWPTEDDEEDEDDDDE